MMLVEERWISEGIIKVFPSERCPKFSLFHFNKLVDDFIWFDGHPVLIQCEFVPKIIKGVKDSPGKGSRS